MPYVSVNRISLYYEIHGRGEPLLLIQGLGYPCEMWFAQVSVFSKEFTTILFDNRGAGRSEKPYDDYSIRQMAEDAIGLLDHLAVSSAHILGVSMGGLIAQEMAIEFPRRVKRLILLSTHYGTGYWEATKTLWKEILSTPAGTLEEILREKLRFAVAPAFHQRQWETLDQMIRILCLNPQPPHAFIRQFEAVKKFTVRERVARITAPTLVLSGTEDRIVPLAFARQLAQQIPQARFYAIQGAGHLAFIEKSDEVNQRILDFLKGQAPSPVTLEG